MTNILFFRALRRTAIACVFVASALAVPSAAHIGQVVIPIYEIPTSLWPDVHDGTLQDWEEAVPAPSLTMSDFSDASLGSSGPLDPESLAYRVFLGWNSVRQQIALGVHRIDDEYNNNYDGTSSGYPDVNSLANDRVTFQIDGNHSGGEFDRNWTREEIGSTEMKFYTNREAQEYWALATSPTSQQLFITGFAQWATTPPYADAGGAVVDGVPVETFTEVYVTPWDLLHWASAEESRRSRLEAGLIIGFQMSFLDMDGGRVVGLHNLGGTQDAFFTADAFFDAILVPCNVDDCGERPRDTAVVNSSWARIKAAVAN